MNILSAQYPLTSPSLHNVLSQTTEDIGKTSATLSAPKRNSSVTSTFSKALPTEDATRTSSLLNQRVALETSTRGKRAVSGYLQLSNDSATGSIVGDVVNNSALVFNRSDAAGVMPDIISGSGSVIQAGSGTITLNADQIRTGSTAFNAGNLSVSGQLGSTNVLITPNRILNGTGSLADNVINSGTLTSENNGPGSILINGSYTQDSNGKLLIRLAAPAFYDQVMVGKKAQLSGTLQVEFLDGFVPSENEEFTILTAVEDVSGTFDEVDLGGLPLQVIYSPFDVKLTFTPTSV